MKPLAVAAQDRALRERYDRVNAIFLMPWGGMWRIDVRPADRPYTLGILQILGGEMGSCLLRPDLKVWVLRPCLERRAEAPDDPIPHLYGEGPPPQLCTFDPGIDAPEPEWTVAMLLADTVVPWAAEWLLLYEIWQVTGRWHGPEVTH